MGDVEEGCPGISLQVAVIYYRGTTPPSRPVFDDSDTTTGTWDGLTFIPPSDPQQWFTSIPTGTGSVYMLTAELKGDNTISYGCIYNLPATTSITPVSGCPPDVSIELKSAIFDDAGVRYAANVVRPPQPNVIRNSRVDIVFDWNEGVTGFDTSDVQILTFSEQTGVATLAWEAGRVSSGSTWCATVNLPTNSCGTAYITVPPASASSVTTPTCGPTTCRCKPIPYIIPEADIIPPTLNIRYSVVSNELVFGWSEEVVGFTAADITLTPAPAVAQPLRVDEDVASIFRMPYIIPIGVSNPFSLRIRIPAGAVSDLEGNENAIIDETLSLTPPTKPVSYTHLTLPTKRIV